MLRVNYNSCVGVNRAASILIHFSRCGLGATTRVDLGSLRLDGGLGRCSFCASGVAIAGGSNAFANAFSIGDDLVMTACGGGCSNNCDKAMPDN